MMKIIVGFLLSMVLLFSFSIQAQETINDSTVIIPADTTTSTTDIVSEQDTIVEPPKPVLDSTKITDMVVAVAPSSLRFRVKPASSETKYITITNDTYKSESFKISFTDYDMNNGGATTPLPANEFGKYGLTRWITASPTFIELGPGEAKKIAVTVSMPDDDPAYRAAWALMMVDRTKEREYIIPDESNKENVVMGVIPTYGFGVYIFQNPPNVTLNKVEITNFTFNYDNENKYVTMVAKNVGDGIGFCKAYVEINNINTGFNERLLLRQFTIFPGMERNLDYMLPSSLAKGKYSVMGVLDFGSDTEIEAAEMEFVIE